MKGKSHLVKKNEEEEEEKIEEEEEEEQELRKNRIEWAKL